MGLVSPRSKVTLNENDQGGTHCAVEWRLWPSHEPASDPPTLTQHSCLKSIYKMWTIGPAARADFRRLYPANAKTSTCCPSDDNRTKVTNSVTSAPSLWWHVGPYFWPADLTRTVKGSPCLLLGKPFPDHSGSARCAEYPLLLWDKDRENYEHSLWLRDPAAAGNPIQSHPRTC